MVFFRRVLFAPIALFWAAMNVWLWRSEFGGGDAGSAVPVAGVWQRILTAPDDSGLEIYHRGKKVGHCRWRPNVGEELSTGKVGSEEYELEGRVKQLTGYTVDVEGNVLLDESLGRVRLELHTSFATNHAWQKITLRAVVRPQIWEIEARASDKSVRLAFDDDEESWERQFSFSDLSNPAKLLPELGLPTPLAGVGAIAGMLSAGALPPSMADVPAEVKQEAVAALTNPTASISPGARGFGLVWSARKDWFTIGHSRVRAYRLQAKLLDRFQAVVIVSRVGEILRVELPNEIVLVNEAFVGL